MAVAAPRVVIVLTEARTEQQQQHYDQRSWPTKMFSERENLYMNLDARGKLVSCVRVVRLPFSSDDLFVM